MELLFIADYDLNALAFFNKNGIVVPVRDKKYTIREVVVVKGEYMLLLNEIRNKLLNGYEPPFHYSRFSDNGVYGVLDWETVNRIYKDQEKRKIGRESGLYD